MPAVMRRHAAVFLTALLFLVAAILPSPTLVYAQDDDDDSNFLDDFADDDDGENGAEAFTDYDTLYADDEGDFDFEENDNFANSTLDDAAYCNDPETDDEDCRHLQGTDVFPFFNVPLLLLYYEF
jgi:hypothetical protein